MQSRFVLLPRIAAALLVFPGLAGTVPAQAPQESPAPPVIQIGVEAVRAGRGAQHTALEQRWAAAFRNANVAAYWLGTTTVTGPNEFWWFAPLESVAALEAQDKAVESAGLTSTSDLLSDADAANVENTRSMLARFRPDLSRPGGDAVPRSRYFEMLIWRIRPGHENKFEEGAKLYSSLAQEAGASGVNWVTYQVFSGMPGPTFITFSTLRSLSELDPGPDMAAMQKVMTPARIKQFNDLSSAGFLTITSMILRFEPKMSYMPADFMAQDPEFWNVRP